MCPIQLAIFLFIVCRIFLSRSREFIVSITTRYGLDGPGIESRWEERFSSPVQNGSEAHPASYIMDTGSFLGVKRPGRGVDHPPPSSAEVKERVQLYLYSPFGSSWPVLVRDVPLLITLGYFFPPWSLEILYFSLDWFI
jgi:hypothetical protein